MVTQVFTIRGATTAENTKESVYARSKELIKMIVDENGLGDKRFNITSIICSSTADITAAYPAAAIREDGAVAGAPLFSCMEPDIDGGLPLCIRLLVSVSSAAAEQKQAKHVYLHGAAVLRPDLIKK